MKSKFERYKRNIILDEIKEEGQLKLINSKVLIAGCGGLGSTVIANLASLGVGNLGLIDNDIVELSNLNRQYIHNIKGELKVNSAKRWIENYNKDIKVKTYNIRLNEVNYKDIIADYDYIVDCFDSFESKFLLNDIAIKTGKVLVHGGVSGFCGQVMTIIPRKTACLRCLFGENIKENHKIEGVVSPIVSAIASFESMEILKLILEKGLLLTNKALTFNGLDMKCRVLDFSVNKDCLCQNC